MTLPKTYKQAAFESAESGLVITEVPLTLPSRGEILVKVESCGICHSDLFAQYDAMGGGFPIVPGHEILGRVAAVGEDVTGWKEGARIGAGWHGGHCGTCDKCLGGIQGLCEPLIVNGVTRNGGYAEYCIVRAQAAVKVPEDLDITKGAPLMCAGLTVYKALALSGLSPGDTIAVQGLGGLGHLALQYARKMGFRVVAISRGRDKEQWARDLGAHEYIDAAAGDAGEALKQLGYAKAVVTTAMTTEAMTPLIKGVGVWGKLIVLSIPQDPKITVDSLDMMNRGISVQAIPVGNCYDCEKAVKFAHTHDIDCLAETFPLEKAQEAYDAMLAGTVRFRAVLVMN